MPSRVQILLLKYMNMKHEKKRVALGKVGKVVDTSLLAVQDNSSPDDFVKGVPSAAEDRALQDVTDWQNEDFIYVY